MKTNLRWVSPLLVVVAACSIPLLGCRRIATDALDRATEVAFAQGNDGKMDVRVGHLPDDFPASVPLAPNADVVTSCRVEADAGEKGWMAAFQTDQSPQQVLAFYQSRLHALKGDAGPGFSELATQLTAAGLATESNGLESTQSFGDQKTVMTTFEFGADGMLVLKTFQRSASPAKPDAKKTFFTVVVTESGRPKS